MPIMAEMLHFNLFYFCLNTHSYFVHTFILLQLESQQTSLISISINHFPADAQKMSLHNVLQNFCTLEKTEMVYKQHVLTCAS